MSNQQYLICDCMGNTQLQILTNEGTGSSTPGPLRFRGKFQEAEAQNKNKRIYSYDILERERARLGVCIRERRLFGELDHPPDSIIHLENASHLVTKLWWDKDTVLMGEGEILPTPAGQILETFIRCGIPVGISSRGVGTGQTNNEGIMIIDPNFRLITFDVVADPSTPNAFASTVENANKQSFYQKAAGSPAKSANNMKKTEANSINNTNTNQFSKEILVGAIKGIFEESLNSKKLI